MSGSPRRQAQLQALSAWPAVVVAAALLVAWGIASELGVVSPYLLPSPNAVLASLGELLAGGDLQAAALVTMRQASFGAILGSAIAIPLGWMLVRSRLAAAALQPYVVASQAIPAVALAPLLVIWFGPGERPVIVLCALLVFFPIVISTTLGLRSLDPDILGAARVDGASGWRMVRHIEAPLAMPAILAGLRNGVTLSITGAVVGEFVIGGRGLGLLLTTQRNSADTAGLFATIGVLCALALLAYNLVRLLEHRLEIP